MDASSSSNYRSFITDMESDLKERAHPLRHKNLGMAAVYAGGCGNIALELELIEYQRQFLVGARSLAERAMLLGFFGRVLDSSGEATGDFVEWLENNVEALSANGEESLCELARLHRCRFMVD